MSETRVCKNCEAELSGEFCHVCGQRDISAGITLKQLLSDFIASTFAWEGPIALTLTRLVNNPGLLVREFIAGKRKQYYKPIQFFIISTFIYLALRSLLDYDPIAEQFKEEVPEDVAEIKRITMAASHFMVKYINHFLFLLPISLAAVLKMFHFKRQSYAEFLVPGFYVTGVYIQIGSVEAIVQEFTGTLPQVSVLRFLAFLAYFSYMHVSYLGGFKVGRLLRSLLIGFIGLVLYILLAFAVALIAVI